MYPSISENNGLKNLTKDEKKIYSIGISTAGAAEIKMAISNPHCKIIATTIDIEGADFARNQIENAGLSKQIEVKVEDVSKPLPYLNNSFDFIYARLVLHYLAKADLEFSLKELNRILKPNRKMFIVVKSKNLAELKVKDIKHDPNTGLTTCFIKGLSYTRFFHTEKTIQQFLLSAGFTIKHVCVYKERLCRDFKRQILSNKKDPLVEVLALKKGM